MIAPVTAPFPHAVRVANAKEPYRLLLGVVVGRKGDFATLENGVRVRGTKADGFQLPRGVT